MILSKVQYDAFMKMRKFFHEQVDSLKGIVPIILPLNDDDAAKISTLMNMLDDIDGRFQRAHSLSDISDIVDLDILPEEWETEYDNITKMSDVAREEVLRFIEGYDDDKDVK